MQSNFSLEKQLLNRLSDTYNSVNSEIVFLKILNEDYLGHEVEFNVKEFSILYKIYLKNNKFYIGQTCSFNARQLAHKARFKSDFIKMEVINSCPDTNAEIEAIDTYRNKYGEANIVNVDKGDPIPEFTIRPIKLWIDKTPTQKAISAYKYYTEQNLQGNKLSMGQVAKEFGSNRNLMDRARQLSKLASEDVVTELWNGAKLKFGASKPTDSLLTAINYYKLLSDEILEQSSGTTADLTDAELEYISELIDNLQQSHSGEFMKHLANTIHSRI